MNKDNKSDLPVKRTWAVIFVLIIFMILIGGYKYYQVEFGHIRLEKYKELNAIGELKAGQIVQWRQERLRDAIGRAESPFFKDATAKLMKNPYDIPLQNEFTHRLRHERELGDYSDVLLLAPDCRVLLASKENPDPVDVTTSKAIANALANGQAELSELYPCPHGVVHIDVVAPVLDNSRRPLAVLVLRNDAEKFLYPLIQSWPIPSRSAETALVCKDGENVLFLNDLRHQEDTALSLRLPLSQSEVPAVQAVLGKQGIFTGKDYRGVKVLANLRPVSGSPWFLVAKVDASEILAEAHYRLVAIAGIAILLVFLTGVIASYSHRQRQARLYRDLYDSEREKRQAQEEQRATLLSIGDAVIATDPQGRITILNPIAEKLTGWSYSEALGKPLAEVFHIINAETRVHCENPVEKVLIHGFIVGLANHTVLISRDGTEHQIADSGAPIHDAVGNVIGVVLVFRDVTDDYRIREKLRMSEERYRTLVENAFDAIYLLRGKHYEYVNPRFCQLTGYSYDELTSPEFDFNVTLTEESKKFIQKRYESRLRGETVPSQYAFQIIRKSGEIADVEVNTVPIGKPGEVVVIGILRDITERKQLESQIRQAVKMETVGRLAGGVAHDFNNLLTVIIGRLEMALDGWNPQDPLYEDLQEVLTTSNRAADLTRQLLAFSRKQILEPRVINFNSIIVTFSRMLRRIIGEDIQMLTVPQGDLWNVKADPGQIEQVIANLASNARDAMPNGGRMTIETQNTFLDETYCRTHPNVTPGEYVMLAISDTGYGMPKEVSSQIFEPFFTTKEIGKGTGLGLATVYGTVKQSGGHIYVYSEVGKGTTFKLYFPRTRETPERITKQTIQMEDVTLHGEETILVVEDEDTVREMTVEVLQLYGYDVIAAKTGGEALQICDQLDKTIDLVLTDVVMPNMSGVQFIERLRLKWHDIKALYMSGYTANAVVHHGVLDHDMPFIQKPFRLMDLLKKVKEVINPPSDQ